MELSVAPTVEYLNKRLSKGNTSVVKFKGKKIRGLLPIGGSFFFEYHCAESHQSSDAHLWYRSHQKVTIIGVANCDPPHFTTLRERAENANLIVYRVKFDDGHTNDVFEDELMESPKHFCRPDPPLGCTVPK